MAQDVQMHERMVIRVRDVLVEAYIIGWYQLRNGTKWLVFETEGGMIYFREAGTIIPPEKKINIVSSKW